MFRKNPGFTSVALIVLALGVGANTAIFTVLNTVMLRPLPFSEPERLVRIWESNPEAGWPTFSASQPTFLDWQSRATAFERLTAVTSVQFSLTSTDDAELVRGYAVAADFLPVLGVSPAVAAISVRMRIAPEGTRASRFSVTDSGSAGSARSERAAANADAERLGVDGRRRPPGIVRVGRADDGPDRAACAGSNTSTGRPSAARHRETQTRTDHRSSARRAQRDRVAAGRTVPGHALRRSRCCWRVSGCSG